MGPRASGDLSSWIKAVKRRLRALNGSIFDGGERDTRTTRSLERTSARPAWPIGLRPRMLHLEKFAFTLPTQSDHTLTLQARMQCRTWENDESTFP